MTDLQIRQLGKQILELLIETIEKKSPNRDWKSYAEYNNRLMDWYATLTPEEQLIFDKGRLVGRFDACNYICYKKEVKE